MPHNRTNPYLDEAPAPDRAASELGRLEDEILGAEKMAAHLLDRARRTADRLFGNSPALRAEGEVGNRPHADAQLARLTDGVQSLAGFLQDLHNELERLERL